MPTDDDVQELLDRSRIADTIYAYCDYADTADTVAIVGLFTDDGAIDLGGGAVHRGTAELLDVFDDRFALYSITSFHGSGIRIAHYDGETATVMSYLYAVHDNPELDNRMQLWGRWEDEMVRDGRIWKFRRRNLRVASLAHTGSQVVPGRFNRIDRVPPRHE